MAIPKTETHENGGSIITDLLRISVCTTGDEHGREAQQVVIQTLIPGIEVHQEARGKATYLLRATVPAVEAVPAEKGVSV